LRFIPLSLRRTARTPHSTGFARLELGLFTKPSVIMTLYNPINPAYALAGAERPKGVFRNFLRTCQGNCGEGSPSLFGLPIRGLLW
jgi:hypothetical protein